MRLNLVVIMLLALIQFSCNKEKEDELTGKIVSLERERVLSKAEKYLEKPVLTITSEKSKRSTGGIHDFYSEGDYWWPDTTNPGGPYIRRDGLTNPENFIAHRVLMRDLSLIVPNLTAAYLITKDTVYANKAIEHLKAWFVNDATKMNPNMLYSQAIFGRYTGRGIGIIDAIHLVEVVKAADKLEAEGVFTGPALEATKGWFAAFNDWITTHQYGIDERDNGNNHSTCWAMQVAMYAQFNENDSLVNAMESFFKHTLVPDQLAADGSFPKEIARTKPYGYSLFNLDAMYTLAEILSWDNPDIWNYQYRDSLSLKSAVDFMYPYVADKLAWPYQEDVMYFDDWPMRHAAFLFAYQAYDKPKYFELWKDLNPSSEKNEIIRNFFVRQPLIWI